jgi:hypothetical protein
MLKRSLICLQLLKMGINFQSITNLQETHFQTLHSLSVNTAIFELTCGNWVDVFMCVYHTVLLI